MGLVMKVEEVLATMDKMKIIEVSTVSDPSRVGVHKFGSVAAKIRFFQRVNNKEFPWNSGEGMWLSSNKTLQERLLDKTLGQIRPKSWKAKASARQISRSSGPRNCEVKEEVNLVMKDWKGKGGMEQ